MPHDLHIHHTSSHGTAEFQPDPKGTTYHFMRLITQIPKTGIPTDITMDDNIIKLQGYQTAP